MWKPVISVDVEAYVWLWCGYHYTGNFELFVNVLLLLFLSFACERANFTRILFSPSVTENMEHKYVLFHFCLNSTLSPMGRQVPKFKSLAFNTLTDLGVQSYFITHFNPFFKKVCGFRCEWFYNWIWSENLSRIKPFWLLWTITPYIVCRSF